MYFSVAFKNSVADKIFQENNLLTITEQVAPILEQSDAEVLLLVTNCIPNAVIREKGNVSHLIYVIFIKNYIIIIKEIINFSY